MMRHFSIVLVCCALTASCKKDVVSQAEPPRPDDLLAILSLPTGTSLADYTSRLNSLGIPAGIALGPMESGLKELIGKVIKDPEAIDYEKPMTFLILGDKGTPPWFLIAATKKKVELTDPTYK